MDKVIDDFALTGKTIKRMLDTLSSDDDNIKKAVSHVGYPPERRRPHGFATILRVISGQQLSVKAAATIADRVEALMGGIPTPQKANALSDDQLRTAGMSRQKISYIRSLSDAVQSGSLDLAALPMLDDEDAVQALISVKGLGRWSAEMYLMFSLGRVDIWPVDDLAVRVGAGRIMGYSSRPDPKEVRQLGKRWAGSRSAVALLAWHYYANAPL